MGPITRRGLLKYLEVISPVYTIEGTEPNPTANPHNNRPMYTCSKLGWIEISNQPNREGKFTSWIPLVRPNLSIIEPVIIHPNGADIVPRLPKCNKKNNKDFS